jgi:protein involved in polysaccharide export with SLBB domain
MQVVLQGQFVKPGVYNLPSLTDAYAALFPGGGPNDFGSFRKIEVIRNNQVVSHIDLYDFLTKGTKKGDITLKDQDVIRIPTYDVRVLLSGQVKIPGYFEVLPSESLQSVLDFAGGFTDQAYTTRIQTIQIDDQQRRIHDLFEGQFATYKPKRGDKFIVGRVLDRYENRVSIKGAVFKPADYELTDGLTISQLIKNAGGLREDAFAGRGSLVRLKPDNTKEQISFSVADAVANKTGADIALKREDEVTISSIFDLRDRYRVSIKGEVRRPGDFEYADSMKVADLIVRAGGFAEGASTKRLEVTRRVYDSDPHSKDSKVANVYSVDINGALKFGDVDFTLKPYDIVSVYSLPGFELQRTVRVEGEVIYPGPYGIEKKNEKISDIITRAGGLSASADVEGASLKRDNISALSNSKTKIDTAELNREQSNRLNRLKRSYKDSTNADTSQLRNNYVGIDLKYILQHPGGPEDLILEKGDILRVPKAQQTVKVNGEVLFPSAVVFNSGKSYKGYILNAGGFSPRALRSGAYVVYPNGTVKGTRKFLFFNVHPQVKPGSELFVPQKPLSKPIGPEIIGYLTGLASIGAIILGIITVSK